MINGKLQLLWNSLFDKQQIFAVGINDEVKRMMIVAKCSMYVLEVDLQITMFMYLSQYISW